MTTKRQIIGQAYTAAGLASYAYDLTAEELQAAMRSLDSMIAQWNIRGVRMGYNSTPDMDAESGLPDWAIEAAVLNLSLRLSGSIGKAVTPDTQKAATQAYNAIMAATVRTPSKARNMRVLGQGWKPYVRDYDNFISETPADLSAGTDGKLEL